MYQECFRCIINIEMYTKSIVEVSRGCPWIFHGCPRSFLGAPHEFPWGTPWVFQVRLRSAFLARMQWLCGSGLGYWHVEWRWRGINPPQGLASATGMCSDGGTGSFPHRTHRTIACSSSGSDYLALGKPHPSVVHGSKCELPYSSRFTCAPRIRWLLCICT